MRFLINKDRIPRTPPHVVAKQYGQAPQDAKKPKSKKEQSDKEEKKKKKI